MKKIFKSRSQGIEIMMRDGFILKETNNGEDLYWNENEKASAIGFLFNNQYVVYVKYSNEEYENELDK